VRITQEARMSARKGFRTANRRYAFLFWPMMIAYVAILLGAFAVIDSHTTPIAMRALAAIVIALPLLFAMFAVWRRSEETDEYSRLSQLLSIRDAALVTASLLFITGFFQMFHVIGTFPVWWFGVFFCAATGCSAGIQKLGKTV
jgi:hypothetical protein